MDKEFFSALGKFFLLVIIFIIASLIEGSFKF